MKRACRHYSEFLLTNPFLGLELAHLRAPAMTTAVLGACCRHCGGAPAGGAPISSVGSTGACLPRALQLMENPLHSIVSYGEEITKQ